MGTVSRMFSLLIISLLTTLTMDPPPPILGSSLPDGCEDFTLGSCNTEQDELIEKYTGIPDAPGCQALCGYIERCQHFRYTKSSQECELFHFRFLTTCNIVAGPKAPLVAACSKEDAEGGSCHSFISEDCIYSGTPVMATDGLTTSSACQEILIQFGSAVNAKYFVFNKGSQSCVLYDSQDMQCKSYSGPKLPTIQSCTLQ